MPADCWSAGVILFIMLSCVTAPFICGRKNTILLASSSGSHPFDTGGGPDSHSDWFTHIRESHAVESSQISQTYIHTESKLKARIIGGRVDFGVYPWKELPDGPWKDCPGRSFLPTNLRELARSLVECLLVYKYQSRATARSALQNRWFTCESNQLEHLYKDRIVDGSEPA